MIIYLAGAGVHPEKELKIKNNESVNWGILISYKDTKSNDGKGNQRFKNIKKIKSKS